MSSKLRQHSSLCSSRLRPHSRLNSLLRRLKRSKPAAASKLGAEAMAIGMKAPVEAQSMANDSTANAIAFYRGYAERWTSNREEAVLVRQLQAGMDTRVKELLHELLELREMRHAVALTGKLMTGGLPVEG